MARYRPSHTGTGVLRSNPPQVPTRSHGSSELHGSRISPLKERSGQTPQNTHDNSAQTAQRLKNRQQHQPQSLQSKREWRQRMETQPVAPSFLPSGNQASNQAPQRYQAILEPAGKDFSPPPPRANYNGGSQAVPPLQTERQPFPQQAPLRGAVPMHRRTPSQSGDVGMGQQPLNPGNPSSLSSLGPPPPDSRASGENSQRDGNSELGLPSIRELEEEQKELQQRRQDKGKEALWALEQEARSQEVERVRSSHVEVPNLNLEMHEGHSYLHAAHLNKRYGRKVAVQDISISLRQGEVVGLLGPNGAGKTTCFYMIAGFVRPTSGEILLDERDISRWPMFKRARQGISYLPQEASIFRSLTVEQNLLAILEYRRNMKRRARIEMSEFLMERLGVLRLRKQRASTLSGGERRRVEIARALALEPSFLLLDEPFAGIDPIAVSEIKGIILALAQSNIGILITDHNVRDTLDITDRSYIVNLGEILVSGSRSELIASKVARDVYLGAEFS